MALALTDASHHRVRHVVPTAGAEPGMVPSGVSILGTPYSFRDLPISSIPETSDFSEASWTARLNDAGALSITFPNREASDGVPWRNRFSTYGHTEFLEVYRDDVLEQVAVILTAAPSQQAVIVTGQDGWFLLRDAYERDYQCLMAPRDVIERYTYVWTLTLGMNFEGMTLPEVEEAWVFTQVHGYEGVGPNGYNIYVNTSTVSEGAAEIKTTKAWTIPAGGRWSLNIPFNYTGFQPGTGQAIFVEIGAAGEFAALELKPEVIYTGAAEEAKPGEACAVMLVNGVSSLTPVNLPQGFASESAHTFLLESDGRWIRGFVDGYLIGYVPQTFSGEVNCIIRLRVTKENLVLKIVLQDIVFRQTQALLMRGEDKGDYVLPGGVQTYPYGGLTGRYYNDADLGRITGYQGYCFAPNRPGSGSGGSYKDRTDSTIPKTIEPPFPGAAKTYWSCRWFGAVWLALSKGNYTFTLNLGHGGARLWVGKTQFGAQLIDDWNGGSEHTDTKTLTAASLGGVDGWYPIILEFFMPESAAQGAVELKFTPPGTYNDPGGAELKSGVSILVPSTSLSPLGCVDQRYQGQPHFQITQDIAAAFGYQMTCVPQQLESGAFPGQLAPHAHVGRETDERLTKDDILSDSPIVNYKSTVDATDQVSSLRAIGSGLPNGQNGQIQVEEYDLPTMQASLFDLQGWVDNSGVNSPALLGASCASQLELQQEPWQNIEGEPLARDRLTDTFPLTGALAALHWRPGDGVRIWLPSINVEDLTPRQIMQVTRQFGPLGRHATQMGFRQRPLDRVSVVNRLIRGTKAATRSYQRQAITLPVAYSSVAHPTLAAGEGTWASVPLTPADIIVSAKLIITANSAAQNLGLETLPGSSFVSVVKGLAGIPPLTLDVTSMLVCRNLAGAGGDAYIQVKNEGGSSTVLGMHLHVIVLR